ncbi:MAG TPA: hypothetical protein VGE76_07230, partial [Opitutaceae bacterium]
PREFLYAPVDFRLKHGEVVGDEHVLGDSLLDTKMFPASYYISRFPTADELRRLKESPAP